jgi:hypothetical protein
VREVREMGFLEVVGQENTINEDDTRYRVKRILKAFIDADELGQLAQQIRNTIA